MKYNEKNYNYVRNRKNTARACLENKELAMKKKAERKQENREKYGKYPDLIIIGEKDRLNGLAPQKIDDDSMQISYNYGYYERGSRVLEGLFSKGIYTEQEQRNFGIVDKINGVPDKNIVNLKSYKSYMEGRIYQKGSEAYDFMVENNISFEEYVIMMGLFVPEVNEPSFKEGYYSRKEKENTQKKR